MTRNILFVDASLAHGGAQRSLFSLVTHLDEDRYRPHLLSGNDSMYGLLKLCRKRSIDAGYMSIRTWKRDLQGIHHAVVDLIKAKPVLNRWIDKHKIDLLYANGIQSALLCAMAAPPDLPMVYHNRDYRALKAAVTKALKRCTRSVVVSDYLLDHWRQMCPDYADRMVRVYNGFDFEQMHKLCKSLDFRHNMGWGQDRFIVLLIADMVPWKRHSLFIKAFAKVAERNPHAFAFIVGSCRDDDGQIYETQLFRQVEEAGLLERLAFTDHVLNPFPLIEAANVVVSTAENEPFGRTIVEALFCGKPVVTVPGGGPEEIGRGCPAVAIAEPEPEAIADAIMAWDRRTPYQLAETAAEARAVANRFSLQQHLDGIYDVLQECLPGNPAAVDTQS